MSIRLFRGFLVIALLVGLRPESGCGAYFSNVLQNASFELGSGDAVVSNWTSFAESHRYSFTKAHSGSYAVIAWPSCWPPGEWGASGLFQVVPAVEGHEWEASVWVYTETNIPGQAFATIGMRFLNAATQMIYEATAAEPLNASSPTGQWTRIFVRGRTTLNTAFIQVTPAYIWPPSCEPGSAWFDDVELFERPIEHLQFAGRDWLVLDGYSTPGNNYWSTNCLRVDTNGWLHMEVKKIGNQWYCPFVETTQSLGFGEYRWYTSTRLDRLDSNLVVGLFNYAQESVYNTNQIEVDIEVSHSFPGTQTNCLVYTVQPYTIPGNSYSHPMETTNDLTTHRFIWRPDRVDWQSYYGHTPEPLDPDHYIAGWRFEGRGIPIETNERAYMNLWLFYTNAPIDTQHVEMIIRDFTFVPFDGFLLSDAFDDATMSNCWVSVGTAVVETAHGLVVAPEAGGTAAAGYATADTVHRNERGERYIFSALLSTMSVTTARSGEDLRALMWLSAATNLAQPSTDAAMVQGRYDESTRDLTIGFYTKTNSAGGVGTLRFDGTLTNAASRFASGGVEIRMEMDNVDYAIVVRDAQGRVLALSTNSGSASGAHELAESLCYGYWFIGAQNSAADSQGTVTYGRAALGIGFQTEPFLLSATTARGGVFSFSGAGFFDTLYTVEKTTNLMQGFTPFLTSIPVTSPQILFTDSQDTASAYYRMKLE